MVQCVVNGCKSRTDVHTLVHFHRVPKNPKIRQKWLQALRRNEIKENARICSNHFKKENYFITAHGLHKLLKTSVPDINLDPVQKRDCTTSVSNNDDDEASNGSEDSEQQLEKNEMTPKSLLTDYSSTQLKSSLTVKTSEPTAQCNPPRKLGPKKNKEPDDNARNQVKTPLERKLLAEVNKLKKLNEQRLEAIKCLEEQNRRLLLRNTFLQNALDNCDKVAEDVKKEFLNETDCI